MEVKYIWIIFTLSNFINSLEYNTLRFQFDVAIVPYSIIDDYIEIAVSGVPECPYCGQIFDFFEYWHISGFLEIERDEQSKVVSFRSKYQEGAMFILHEKHECIIGEIDIKLYVTLRQQHWGVNFENAVEESFAKALETEAFVNECLKDMG